MTGRDAAVTSDAVAQDGAGDSTGGGRLGWLDAARGIGIILVVYAHGARALFDVLPHLEAFQWADRVIYAFHMPLFFFLAGLVSPPSLTRSRIGYVRSKIVTVVYPYFLWSIVYWALEYIFRNRVNSPLEVDAILWILWKPIEHLWFLYVLFLCQVLAAVIWPRVIALVVLCMWFFLGPLPPTTVPEVWVQLPWFTAGLLVAPLALKDRGDVGRQSRHALALAALFGLGSALLYPFAPLARVVEFLLAGVGISLTIALAGALNANRVLAYLGQASLSIYLLHTIFAAGVREFLEAFFPVNAVVLLAITVIAGLVAPVVIHEFARRTGVAAYLGLGRLAPTSRGGTRSQGQAAA